MLFDLWGITFLSVSRQGHLKIQYCIFCFPTCSLLQIGANLPWTKPAWAIFSLGCGSRTWGIELLRRWLRWIQASWKPTTVRHVWHPRYIGTLISGQHGMRVEWHTTSYDNIAVGSSFGMVFGEKHVQQISCWTNGKRKMRCKSSPTKKWMICIHGYNGINMWIDIHIIHISILHNIHISQICRYIFQPHIMSAQQTNQYRTSQSPLWTFLDLCWNHPVR
jgi:hypothetical protein